MKSSSNDPEMQSWNRIATCARLKMRIEELREENDKLREVLKAMGFNTNAPIEDLLSTANIFLEEQKELIEERGKMICEKFKLRDVIKEAIEFFDYRHAWMYKAAAGMQLKQKLREALGEEGK